MKRLSSIVGLAVLLAVLPACAQHHHYSPYRHHHHGGYNNSWIAPFIIGAGATYILTRPPVQPAPVVQSQPIVIQPGQQLVCRPIQVYDSYRGVYESRQECWAQ